MDASLVFHALHQQKHLKLIQNSLFKNVHFTFLIAKDKSIIKTIKYRLIHEENKSTAVKQIDIVAKLKISHP